MATDSHSYLSQVDTRGEKEAAVFFCLHQSLQHSLLGWSGPHSSTLLTSRAETDPEDIAEE